LVIIGWNSELAAFNWWGLIPLLRSLFFNLLLNLFFDRHLLNLDLLLGGICVCLSNLSLFDIELTVLLFKFEKLIVNLQKLIFKHLRPLLSILNILHVFKALKKIKSIFLTVSQELELFLFKYDSFLLELFVELLNYRIL